MEEKGASPGSLFSALISNVRMNIHNILQLPAAFYFGRTKTGRAQRESFLMPKTGR